MVLCAFYMLWSRVENTTIYSVLLNTKAGKRYAIIYSMLTPSQAPCHICGKTAPNPACWYCPMFEAPTQENYCHMFEPTQENYMNTIDVYVGGFLHEVHEYSSVGELINILAMLTDNAYMSSELSFRVR